MSVRRKYSLPGCTLILEGVTTETGGRRPTISAVVNAECHLLGHSQILAGGQGFLQQLTETLSAYTQSLLSGIVPVIPEGHIAIEPLPPLQHRLTITDPGLEAPVSLDLSTLQLFDLLESLDQMLADARTLPGWSLDLKPLTRHQARLDPPITERATPAAIGLSSLAVAAAALFFLPIPEVRRPTEPTPVSAEEQAQTTTADEAAGSAPPTDQAAATTGTSDRANGQTDSTAANKPKDSNASATKPKATETKTKSPTTETNSTAKPAVISDSDQLYALSLKLDQDLSTNWDTDQAPTGDREYRVSVGQDGAIIGYIGRNEGAESYVDSTPLPDLLYVPTEGGSAKVEAQADFRVVFADSGTIEVSPWNGYAKTPSAPPSLTDTSTVTQSLDDLSTTLYDNFKDEPSFDRALAYRLGMTADGTLAQVEPLTADARNLYGETPLPDLYDPAAAIAVSDDRVTLMPLVEFRVVFKPNGIIEIAPWYGMQ